MNINHNPMFDTEKVEQLYSEKDGVPITYVCTSAIHFGDAYAVDVFYRGTPHPEFGNYYFGLYRSQITDHLMITNADNIENLDFDMVEVNDQLHYSQHRHDFRSVGDISIDGGRAYLRLVGNMSHPVKRLKVENGIFLEKSDEAEMERN